jgi:hypothetical protein
VPAPEDHECDFPDTCNVCRGVVRDPEHEVRESIARYEGECVSCSGAIIPGDPIVGYEYNWRHNDPDCKD